MWRMIHVQTVQSTYDLLDMYSGHQLERIISTQKWALLINSTAISENWYMVWYILNSYFAAYIPSPLTSSTGDRGYAKNGH